ncbi:MAG: hypothetical protein ACKVIQ_16100, partial [Acidimicrobiales bacterium]
PLAPQPATLPPSQQLQRRMPDPDRLNTPQPTRPTPPKLAQPIAKATPTATYILNEPLPEWTTHKDRPANAHDAPDGD